LLLVAIAKYSTPFPEELVSPKNNQTVIQMNNIIRKSRQLNAKNNGENKGATFTFTLQIVTKKINASVK
jgi:hypothetical protein